MDEDIAEKMIEAWNEPFSTDHDPRELLLVGAKEIRRLRRELISYTTVIKVLHASNAEMSAELRSRQPNPNVPIYVIGFLAALMALLAAAIVL